MRIARFVAAFATLSGLATGIAAFGAPRQDPYEVRPIQTARRDRAEVVRGDTEFALDMHRLLARSGGNVAFSPFSLATALSMAAEGAAGRTREQMLDVLHADLRGARRLRAGQSLLAGLRPRDPDGVTLGVANALFARSTVRLLPGFLHTLRAHFGAYVAQSGAADGAFPLDALNRWASDRTGGRIPEALPPDAVTPESAFALVNAVAFDGLWEQPFAEWTERPFHSARGTITAPLMLADGVFGYAETATERVLELGYRGGDFSMVVIAPQRIDGLAGVETSLTQSRLVRLLGRTEATNCHVELPRFGVRADRDLKPELEELGMTVAFDRDAADFSRAVETRLGRAWIGQVRQSARVDVSELGTQATAVTTIVVSFYADQIRPPLDVRIDRPFLWMIRHRPTGTILFLGRVEDPTAE